VAVCGTGGKASPSVTLDSSANPAFVSSTVTLTATVSSSSGSPTGSVDFYDGATLLGSGTLASGTATYVPSNLVPGTHSITVVYSVDSNYSTVTRSALSQVVSDLTLALASGGSSTATISPGETATYHLTIGPSGSVLPAAVTVSASGGPAGSTITITPQTIAPGAGATNVTVTVQVPSATAVVRRSNAWAVGLWVPLIGMLALPFGIERRRLSLKRVHFVVLLSIVVVSTGTILGCGGTPRSTPPTQQPTNYTVTVTASSGSVSHSTPLTLTVQ